MNMKNQNVRLTMGILSLVCILISLINLTSAIAVDADYITIYPGERGEVSIEINNNENYDIEEISVSIDLSQLPFTVVGSSEKDVDDIDEDDDDKAEFVLRASTDIIPGDYEIPYILKYVNSDDDESFSKNGSFGIRVSAKTELDFSVETNANPIVGQEGKISLEIVNKGLGEIKSISVQIFPQGFELLSKEKIFLGTISADDTDLASFDVVYKTKNPTLNAEITYKDFDNKDQTEIVSLPIKVYTMEEALALGLVQK
ncbi:MAG: hypothetical protein ABIH37_05670, partial [archaeon]